MNDLNSLEERIRHLEIELKRVSNPAKIYKPTNADKNDRLISTMESRIKQLELSLARIAQPKDYTPIASADLRNAKTSNLKTIERGGVWSDYSADLNAVGWSSTTLEEGFYMRIGNIVFVMVEIRGTSNTTTAYFDLPITASSSYDLDAHAFIVDNGSADADPGIAVFNTATQVRVYRDATAAPFTASGEKRVQLQFFYGV